MHLAVWLLPDPLGELQRSPRLLAAVVEMSYFKGEREGQGRVRGGDCLLFI